MYIPRRTFRIAENPDLDTTRSPCEDVECFKRQEKGHIHDFSLHLLYLLLQTGREMDLAFFIAFSEVITYISQDAIWI